MPAMAGEPAGDRDEPPGRPPAKRLPARIPPSGTRPDHGATAGRRCSPPWRGPVGCEDVNRSQIGLSFTFCPDLTILPAMITCKPSGGITTSAGKCLPLDSARGSLLNYLRLVLLLIVEGTKMVGAHQNLIVNDLRQMYFLHNS